MATYNDYIAALEKETDYWRTQAKRASDRAEYWAKMYDELTAIKNGELDDDDEINLDDY